jgi:hypothetical protein
MYVDMTESCIAVKWLRVLALVSPREVSIRLLFEIVHGKASFLPCRIDAFRLVSCFPGGVAVHSIGWPGTVGGLCHMYGSCRTRRKADTG